MKIITGEEAPTKGQVKICGHNVINNQSEAFKILGYCPQVSVKYDVFPCQFQVLLSA